MSRNLKNIVTIKEYDDTVTIKKGDMLTKEINKFSNRNLLNIIYNLKPFSGDL